MSDAHHQLHVLAINEAGASQRELAEEAYWSIAERFDQVLNRHGHRAAMQAMQAVLEREQAHEAARRAEDKREAWAKAAAGKVPYRELVERKP